MGTVTFGANVEKQYISIDILNDKAWEKNEYFKLKLKSDPTDKGVFIGQRSETLVTIINEDCKNKRIFIF